jgi:DNA-binding transcriptional regulator YdaS (Cro superfamily)
VATALQQLLFNDYLHLLYSGAQPMKPDADAVALAIKFAGGPSAVARQLGRSPFAVALWRDGKRSFQPEFAAELERLSGGRVRRWQMFPAAWPLIWPELVGTEGAPEVLAAAAAAD